LGVFGGLEDGGVSSGGEFGGSDGDVGGVCGAQPTVIAQSAIAARLDPVRVISALLYEGLISRR